jgi:hypothetical protein
VTAGRRIDQRDRSPERSICASNPRAPDATRPDGVLILAKLFHEDVRLGDVAAAEDRPAAQKVEEHRLNAFDQRPGSPSAGLG